MTTKTKKTSASKSSDIMKEIRKKKAAGASTAEINRLKEKYMNSLTYNGARKGRK